MRKLCYGIAVLFMIGCVGCGMAGKEAGQGKGTGESLTMAAGTGAPLPMEKMQDTIEQSEEEPTGLLEAAEKSDIEPTKEPEETKAPSAKPTKEPEGTKAPGIEPTKAPEETKAPDIEPTKEPERTKAPSVKPTKVLEPTKKPVGEPAQAPTGEPEAVGEAVSAEVAKMLEDAVYYPNTVMQEEVQTSEAAANEFVRKMTQEYSLFGLLVSDAAYLHTPEQYRELYPEIVRMEVNKIGIYNNGIFVLFSGVEPVYDANLCYAIRTGDGSVLSETEKELYRYLETVVAEEQTKELSSVEAVKALHDYLVLHLKYDETLQMVSHSPEGVMKNQTAVCDGYARTMRLLLLLSGIECEIVSGTAKGEDHAWNLVHLEDGWYHVDVTWDDPLPDEEGRVLYTYFLRNDAYMAQDHVWESDISCTGTAYEIYAYEEYLCNSYEALAEVCEKQLREERLTFCYPKNGALTSQEIKEYVMNRLQTGITFYPETELGTYLVLQIVNPLVQ